MCISRAVCGGSPCNGFNSGYLVPASEMWTMLRKMPTGRGLPDGPSEPVTRTRVRADAKKAAFAYRMPLIQNSGLLDGTMARRAGRSLQAVGFF